MDSTDKLWAVFWVSLATFLCVLFGGLMVMNSVNNRQNVERDKFYASHCQVVRETLGDNGNSAVRDYSCKAK